MNAKKPVFKYVMVVKFKNDPEPEVLGVEDLNCLTSLICGFAKNKHVRGFQPFEYAEAKKHNLHLLIQGTVVSDVKTKKKKLR